MSELPVARRIWAGVEPIASSIYFVPEVHRAYQALGFDGPSRRTPTADCRD